MGATGPVLLIHAGAGKVDAKGRGDDTEIAGALIAALGAGRRVLEGNGDAVAAAQAAVEEMESCELFNAGRGSALCSDGSVQMDAALMRGSDRAAGAVAGMTSTEHPILAARLVLESDQVLLVGPWADRRAAALGARQRDNSFFVTERQRARLRARAGADTRGTVGAVCRDAQGVLAAATSTGGVSGQPPGRVGDSPLIGAGTWADEYVAVSCTGAGEAFVRAAVAHHVAILTRRGATVSDACERALDEVRALGGHGGLIAIDADGATAAALRDGMMPGGAWREGSEVVVWVTERPRPSG